MWLTSFSKYLKRNNILAAKTFYVYIYDDTIGDKNRSYTFGGRCVHTVLHQVWCKKGQFHFLIELKFFANFKLLD